MMEKLARLRREYLCKKDGKDAPLPKRRHITDKGGFFFDGHRLSSLYRRNNMDPTQLIKRNEPVSFLRKYSNQTFVANAA